MQSLLSCYPTIAISTRNVFIVSIQFSRGVGQSSAVPISLAPPPRAAPPCGSRQSYAGAVAAMRAACTEVPFSSLWSEASSEESLSSPSLWSTPRVQPSSFSRRVVQGHSAKWSGIAVGADQKLYCAPCNASTVPLAALPLQSNHASPYAVESPLLATLNSRRAESRGRGRASVTYRLLQGLLAEEAFAHQLTVSPGMARGLGD